MAAELTDVPIALRPLWVIDQRIDYHAQAGGLLEGLKVDREGKSEVDGVDDLPYVQWFSISDEEGHGPGAGTGVRMERKLLLMVAAKRDYGMFRRDPTDTSAGVGVMEWLDRVRDAIETKADGTGESDPLLDGTQSRPILTAIRESAISDLSFTLMLEVTLTIESVCRATRSLVDDIEP
jgi:hypothetical protein